jgi:hypothetical protein
MLVRVCVIICYVNSRGIHSLGKVGVIDAPRVRHRIRYRYVHQIPQLDFKYV